VVIRVKNDIYLDAREACDLLGVKPQTLYAYVSRGIIRSYRRGIQRRRLYKEREVRGLVELGPGRRRGQAGDRRKDHPSRGEVPARGRSPRADDASRPVPNAEDWIGNV
jgi:excisionase family DNA binding protein